MLKLTIVFLVCNQLLRETYEITPIGTFCSAVCKPNSCTGPLPTDCTNCDTNFILSGTTCNVNPTSGWELVDTSTDLGGTMTLDLGSTDSCGMYSFSGNFTRSDTITLTFSGGIPDPFYQIQLIYWIILVDDVDGST